MPDRTITPLQKAAGQWLKERRLGAGLTQHELARRLGFKYYTHLSAIEATGKGRIAPRHYVDAARALKMDPKDFTWEQLGFYEPEDLSNPPTRKVSEVTSNVVSLFPQASGTGDH